MTNDERLELVLKLLLDNELEDVTRSERAALIDVCHRLDATLNKQTYTNDTRYGVLVNPDDAERAGIKYTNTNDGPKISRYYFEPSRLARRAGCDKATCKVCKREPDRTLPANK